MVLFPSFFSKKKNNSEILNEADKLMQVTQQFITRTDLIAHILRTYEKAKTLPEREQLTLYCQTYFALENFITSNKPLVVQKVFTRDSLRKEIKAKLTLDNLPIPLRIIFLDEHERALYLYESSARDLAENVVSQLGKGSVEKILSTSNTALFVPFTHHEVDFVQLHRMLVAQTISKASVVFKTINTLLYEEIVRSLGANTAQEVIKKNYTLIKERYEYDFISHYLEVLPEGVLERERVAYLTRDELEKRATIAAEEKVRRETAEESAKKLQQMVEEQTRELTQEKEAIDRERNKLSTVLSSITDAVVAVDSTRTIILCNTAAERLLGISSSAVTGKHINDIVAMYDGEKQLFFEDYIKQDADMVAKLKKGLHILTAANKTIYIEAAISPLVLEPTNATGWVMTMHDITKEQELEDMKLDFVSMAAHELRTPLTAIRGYTALLRDDYGDQLDDAGKAYMNRLMISTKNLAGLIDNLLNVSRIERNTFKVELAPMDVGAVIKDTVTNLEEQAKTKQQTLTYIPPATPLPSVIGDSSRITQVMTNLIANAINYTQEKGEITISAEPVDGFVEIKVKDNGQGIPKEAQAKLFSKFFRVSGVLEQGSKGTGLGLFITKSIIELHHGTIGVDSEMGVGSTFHFTLPIAPSEHGHDQTITQQEIPTYSKKGVIYNDPIYQKHLTIPIDATTKKRILLVEDDVYIRELYSVSLQKAGYEVISAADGQEGIEKAEKEKFDMILLDIMMPKITGVGVLRTTKKEGTLNYETPTFLITNLGQESIIKEAFSLGADGYYMKSQLTPPELTEEITEYFKKRTVLQQKPNN